MQAPLLRAKITHPTLRANLVQRTHLLERLEAGMHQGQQLTLVCAPAGFGKTTLVAEWLQRRSASAAWLSLDAADNDPARFFAYLIASLRQINPQIGANSLAMMQSPQPPPVDSLLAILFQEINTSPETLTLVLDDYHLIEAAAIHHQLNFLLEYQPTRLHLVIVTRTDPPIPLHRLRARGQMNEIRQDDLRFAGDEAAAFFHRISGITLSASQVTALVQRTEGWITGLQLAALVLLGGQASTGPTNIQAFLQAFTSDNRFILDYLFEEVFRQQDPQVQDFLMRSSILNQFCPALCEALLEEAERTSSGGLAIPNIIAYLEGHNLFIIPLDASRTWFRYHHLFLDLLRHRLHLQAEVNEVELQRRASRWYAANGYLVDAMPHALSAADWEQAARIILQVSPDMMKNGEYKTLLAWYGQIPDEVYETHLRLCYEYSWPLILSGELDTAEVFLKRAERAAQADLPFRGQIYTAKAYLARTRGDIPQAVALSHKALALLPADAWSDRGMLALNLGIGYWHAGRMKETEQLLNEARRAALQTGNRYAELTALIFLSRTQAVRGKLEQATQIAQQAIRVGGEAPILTLAELDLSVLAYERNDLIDSEAHLLRSLSLSERSGNLEFLVATHLQQAKLRLTQGKIATAWESVRRSFEIAPIQSISTHVNQRRAAVCVEIALAQGDLAEAESWLNQAGEQTDSHPFYRFLGAMQARLRLAQGNRRQAAEILQKIAQVAEANGWGYGLLATRVLQTLAASDPGNAQNFLRMALEMGNPEGYQRTFIDCGPGIIPLLREAARKGIYPEYVGQILSALKEEAAHPPEQEPEALAEPLSGRELEILRLVAAGLSNREIASQLFLSLGTVKSHVHAICTKLGAASRTQAVAQARMLKLV